MLLLLCGDVEENPGPSNDSANLDSGCVSIKHLNICSIRNKIDYITDNFPDFDILCFTETHLDVGISDADLFLDANKLFRRDCTSSSGGLIVYISNLL